MNCWKGSLKLHDGTEINDIRLDGSLLPEGCTLQFLSHVDTRRIPLHLICGSRLEIWTTCPETESWFSNLVFNDANTCPSAAWWHTATLESPLGILVSVQTPPTTTQPQPRITELLFYASRKHSFPPSPPTRPNSSQHDPETPTPDFQLHALPLSSDLLLPQTYSPSPPPSPTQTSTLPPTGTFLPPPWSAPTLAQKRKLALETTFLAATELRRSQKRNPGTSIAAAAAGPSTLSFNSLPRLKPTSPPKRNVSNPSVPLLTRPKSQSPSIPTLRRDTTTTETRRASGLQRVATPNHDQTNDLVQRNKDAISKVVLAGMRVWGFTQSKKKKMKPVKSTTTTTTTSESQDTTRMEETDKSINDEEYKLVYHHVYKAAVFAFRNCVGNVELSVSHTDRIRDTVDGLLGIFCKDPLHESGVGGGNGEGGCGDMGQGPKGAVVRTPGAEEEKRRG